MPQLQEQDRSMGLTDDQRFALMKMRRNVADCLTLPYHNDQFILRWLRARNFDPIAAEKMMRASLKWREQWGTDRIQEWPTPEVFQHYYPSGVSGFDKDGSPIIILPFAGIDIQGMLHSVSKNDFVKMAMKTFESNLELARRQAEKHGEAASQIVAILDLTGFNLKQYAWRPAAEAVISLVQMYEANYPEILKACYIINVSKMFFLGFSVIKNFLNDYTLSKIHIYKNDPSKWQPIIMSHIDPSQLPALYGGTQTDPDGNPACPSKIRPGGKIPKSYYMKNQLQEEKEDYSAVTIKKGEKVNLNFEVKEMGSFLRWSFYSDGHDIKFGITRKDKGGKEITELAPHRVTCDHTEEEGFLQCDELGISPKAHWTKCSDPFRLFLDVETPETKMGLIGDPTTLYSPYVVCFDNTYSYLRNKKIHYSIAVMPPLSKDPIIEKFDGLPTPEGQSL